MPYSLVLHCVPQNGLLGDEDLQARIELRKAGWWPPQNGLLGDEDLQGQKALALFLNAPPDRIS